MPDTGYQIPESGIWYLESFKSLNMITRHWTGVAKKEQATAYIDYLEKETFKKLMGLQGFMDASILKREVADGIEFLVITTWHSREAIKAFTGEDINTAVVPPVVRDMMVRFDELARNYEIAYAVYTH